MGMKIENDPVVYMFKVIERLYPQFKDIKVYTGDLSNKDSSCIVFPNEEDPFDGPFIILHYGIEYKCIPETIGHEIAHLVVGFENDHNETWETEFTKIKDEYNRLVAAVGKIEEIGLLKKNWNSNDADPFDNEFIDNIKNLVVDLPYVPEVFPTAAKSIQLEYNIGESCLEIELYENGKMGMYKNILGNEFDTDDIDFSREKIINIVNEFYGLKV